MSLPNPTRNRRHAALPTSFSRCGRHPAHQPPGQHETSHLRAAVYDFLKVGKRFRAFLIPIEIHPFRAVAQRAPKPVD